MFFGSELNLIYTITAAKRLLIITYKADNGIPSRFPQTTILA